MNHKLTLFVWFFFKKSISNQYDVEKCPTHICWQHPCLYTFTSVNIPNLKGFIKGDGNELFWIRWIESNDFHPIGVALKSPNAFA
jgi:hypothetical protein